MNPLRHLLRSHRRHGSGKCGPYRSSKTRLFVEGLETRLLPVVVNRLADNNDVDRVATLGGDTAWVGDGSARGTARDRHDIQ
jgi:hypothetical protein